MFPVFRFAVPVLQQLCRQHVSAVPQSGALEGLSVRRAYVHFAQFGSQVIVSVADLFRNVAPKLGETWS